MEHLRDGYYIHIHKRNLDTNIKLDPLIMTSKIYKTNPNTTIFKFHSKSSIAKEFKINIPNYLNLIQHQIDNYSYFSEN